MNLDIKKGDLVRFVGPFLRRLNEPEGHPIYSFKNQEIYALVLGDPFVPEFIKVNKKLNNQFPARTLPGDWSIQLLAKDHVFVLPVIWIKKVT